MNKKLCVGYFKQSEDVVRNMNWEDDKHYREVVTVIKKKKKCCQDFLYEVWYHKIFK